MNTDKNHKFQKSILKSTLFAILILVAVVCFPNTAKSSNAEFRAKYGDVREYVKLNGVSYEYSREMFGKDQLPVLYELLSDENYAPYWHNVANVIGYISDDPNSVPVLLDYFQRDDGANISDQSRFLGKIWSLAWIGKIGGELADSVLRKVATVQGAEELAKEWIDKELWPIGDRGRTLESIQRAAIHGLVYSANQENHDFVERLYSEQKDISIKNNATSDLMNTLIDAMAKRDFIADNGIEEFFRIEGKETLYLPGLSPYLNKYSISFPRSAFLGDSQKIGTRELFKTKWIGGLTYSRAINSFDSESLPVLHELLSDPQYSFHWYNIASSICYISKDPNSVEEIVKYIQRPKELSNEGFDVIAKGRILSNIGFIKNKKVNDLLAKALTENGAAELTKSWIDKTQDYNDTIPTKEEMLGLIRGSAAIGLIHSQFPTNIRLVEQLYEKEYAICKEKRIYTELFNQLVDAMAIRDLIEEIGMEEYLKLQGKEHNKLSPYIRKYNWRSPEEAAKAEFRAKYSDLKEFIKLEDIPGHYNQCVEMFGKDDLPQLYEMLKDEGYSSYWHNVANVIGFISDDPESVPVLLEYFQRDEGSKLGPIAGKIHTIGWIGLIGGDMAESILRKAVTTEGAKELAKDWIKDGLWSDKNWNQDMAIEHIKGHAMQGLIYTRKPENIQIVKDMYAKEKQRVIKEQGGMLDTYVIDAMAINDAIIAYNNDVKAYLHGGNPEIDLLDIVFKYLDGKFEEAY